MKVWTAMSLQNRLSFAANLAREAGALAQSVRGAHEPMSVDTKGPQDFVTSADLRVEGLIRARITERYAEDAIIGEEGGRNGDTSCGGAWIIDPIDGTTNFMRGMPDWAVSIAWAQDGEILLGVIFAPDHNLLLEGALSETPVARKNGAPLTTGRNTSAREALIAVGWSPRTDFADHTKLLAQIIEHGGEYRRTGAATIGLIGVACGWVDAYFEHRLNLWDAAAGIAILKATGAYILAPAFTSALDEPAPFLAFAQSEHELAPLLRKAAI